MLFSFEPRRCVMQHSGHVRHGNCIGGAMNLRDRVVVVTGGTAGVGHAAATAFARRGARVVVLSRDAERVRAAAHEIDSAEGRVVDMSDYDAVEQAAADIERSVGPIDVWVNNAMTTVFGRFMDMTPADFAKVTANTYLGAVNGTYAALKRMRMRDRGAIVQVGSALAFQAIPLQSAYCGAKHGIRGFTNAVRCELIAERSRVSLSMVHLSAFNTPQFEWARSRLPAQPRPLGTIFDPAVAADAIVHAALRPRREFWVGWPAVQTILASRLVPGFAERLAAKMAVSGQMIEDEPAPPRAGNLYQPVARPPGSEGRFHDEERHTSVQWRLSKYRGVLLGVALGLVGVKALSAALRTCDRILQSGSSRGRVSRAAAAPRAALGRGALLSGPSPARSARDTRSRR
jgi:NAD(P)-dependent dehydrogenase (short-subunit alcohol dehydrogenase family)